MKLIVAGSRNIEDDQLVSDLINMVRSMYSDINTIISGTARGVDSLGERYAYDHNLEIEKYPAAWKKYGKSAGYKRNYTMAENADVLLAIWDGKSRGTAHMISIAKKLGVQTVVYKLPPEVLDDITHRLDI